MHYDQKEVPMEERYPPERNTADPWKHRGNQMRCHTCMWFVVKAVEGPMRPVAVESLGRCRRHAPTMNGYPVVFQSDWCGDHKLDQNKL
jgi:hypothetical protein